VGAATIVANMLFLAIPLPVLAARAVGATVLEYFREAALRPVLTTVLLPSLTWIICSQFGVAGDSLILLIVMAAGLGYMGPNEFIQVLIKRRRKRIARALPNALDLLVVCVESGLGLDQAIMQVSREMQQSYPELSSEFAIANLEMRHGKRRTEALRNLGERTGVDIGRAYIDRAKLWVSPIALLKLSLNYPPCFDKSTRCRDWITALMGHRSMRHGSGNIHP